MRIVALQTGVSKGLSGGSFTDESLRPPVQLFTTATDIVHENVTVRGESWDASGTDDVPVDPKLKSELNTAQAEVNLAPHRIQPFVFLSHSIKLIE